MLQSRVFAQLTNFVAVLLAGLSVEVQSIVRLRATGVLDGGLDVLGLGGTDGGDLRRVAGVLAIEEIGMAGQDWT